jgi:hypothetical protein
MTILQTADSTKRRVEYNRYLKSLKIKPLDERVVFGRFDDIVFDAMIFGEDTVEISAHLAQSLLVILPDGVKKGKGGQPLARGRELRKRTFVCLAKRRKKELICKGSSATQAHLQAAEETAELARSLNMKISPDYLSREMDKKLRR